MNICKSTGAAGASPDMVSFDELYVFLRERYKHDRFEGRNNVSWCPDYSQMVTRSKFEALRKHGYSCVSQFESKNGEAIFFDRSLKTLDGERLQRAFLGEIS